MKAKRNISAPRRLLRRRVLLVNGLTHWRYAIRNRINRTRDLKVCGEANGEQAGLSEIERLHPDVVLTEIMRPQDLAFIRELHRRYRHLPILAFSFRDEEAYAPRVLEAGARGYLMKSVDGDTLVAGIRMVLAGRVVLSRVMLVRLRGKKLGQDAIHNGMQPAN
ncbi:MAG TPA: response regulator transcription factor [Candidatus Sulfopaludibacter sp.]|nr:response regulator transcription factor [Candidatus Sulfopaludibacter sp.]